MLSMGRHHWTAFLKLNFNCRNHVSPKVLYPTKFKLDRVWEKKKEDIMIQYHWLVDPSWLLLQHSWCVCRWSSPCCNPCSVWNGDLNEKAVLWVVILSINAPVSHESSFSNRVNGLVLLYQRFRQVAIECFQDGQSERREREQNKRCVSPGSATWKTSKRIESTVITLIQSSHSLDAHFVTSYDLLFTHVLLFRESLQLAQRKGVNKTRLI